MALAEVLVYCGRAADVDNGFPQSLQKRAAGSFSWPQNEQEAVAGLEGGVTGVFGLGPEDGE
jgi:hypothetical protein